MQQVADGNDVGRHRRGHRGGEGGDRQAVAHRRAHAHRLRLAQQAGHRRGARRPARRRGGQAHQGGLRLAARARRSSSPTTCARRSSPRPGRRPRPHTEWTQKYEAWRAADAARATVVGRRLGRQAARGLGRRPPRVHRPRTRSRRAPPPARSSTPWRRTCRRSSAARPTSRPPTTRSIKDVGDSAGRDARRAQPPLRRARARHGRHRQRHRPARRHPPLRAPPSSSSSTTCARPSASPRS